MVCNRTGFMRVGAPLAGILKYWALHDSSDYFVQLYRDASYIEMRQGMANAGESSGGLENAKTAEKDRSARANSAAYRCDPTFCR